MFYFYKYNNTINEYEEISGYVSSYDLKHWQKILSNYVISKKNYKHSNHFKKMYLLHKV